MYNILLKFLSLNYHPKNIKMMSEMTIQGVLAANFLAPLIALYVLFDVMPHSVLYIWLFLNFVIFVGRISIAKRLLHLLKTDSSKITSYLKVSLLFTSFSGMLYGFLICASVINDIPDLHIFMLGAIIVSLCAGAISTLVSVYHAFFMFVFFNIVPLIAAVLYHGGEIFNVFAIVLSIFSFIIMRAGYSQHMILNDLISLKETFKTIYEKSSDSIALIKNARFVDCNEATVKMFQFNSKEELLKVYFSDCMPKFQEDGSLSAKKMLTMVKITLKNEKHSFECLCQKSTGELFWAEVVLTKIFVEGEELIHAVLRDISRRKKLEDEREELHHSLEDRVRDEVEKNREKDKHIFQQSRLAQMGEMISMIAHQWRQPLAAISSVGTAMHLKAKRDKLDRETALKLSKDITVYSQHLSTTIDDFRDFFKSNNEKKETTYSEIIHSVLNIVETSINTQNIRIIKDLRCDTIFSTYSNEMKQVILNLIKNAEDALLENEVKDPFIRIVTYVKDNTYVLEVSDNAGGIPQDIMENIFDPYFSTKIKKDGTGLGLYMSKVIVEEHCHGNLHVNNSNEGAVFTIVLQA